MRGKNINEKNLQNIIDNTKIVLDRAIKLGGTTIKSYTSSEGVHGRFQNELLVHTKEICPECNNKITKIGDKLIAKTQTKAPKSFLNL